MNVEESETEQMNDGLSIQNPKLPSDGEDSQVDNSSSPVKRPNPKRVQLAGVGKRGSIVYS
jgi:hypothetical protein